MAYKLFFRPLLLAICVCLALSLHAQPGGNALNWDYPYQEIRKTLYKIENLDILREIENEQIAVRHGNIFTTYFFEKGTLYSIEITQTFDKTSKAQVAYDDVIDYFLSTGAVPVGFHADGKETRVIATRNGKVYRLIMRKTDAANIDVTISAKFVNLAPLSVLEGPDFMELNDVEEDE